MSRDYCHRQSKKRLLLTLWEDFSEVEGTKIQQKIESKVNGDERYPVILGRSIGISPYNGLSLQTRFNSTIQIDPAYPQALQLIKWAKENNDMLGGCASDNFSRSPRSSTSLMVIPTQQQIIPIAEIQSQTSKFCVLECSGCK